MSSESKQGEQVHSRFQSPTYGILLINRQYNEGKLTFDEWMKQSHEWSLAMIRQYGTTEDKKRWGIETEMEGAA